MRVADIAEERRLAAMRESRTFAFETVMSTPEKVVLRLKRVHVATRST